MKYLFILIAVLLVVGAWWYYAGQPGVDDVRDTDAGALDDTVSVESDIPGNGPVGGDAATDSNTTSMDGGEPVTVSLSGKNFEFSQKEIRVKEGDTVTINFTNESGTHNWTVDEFDARTQTIQGGSSASVTFVADKKGSFEYYCSVGQHRALGMVGTLIVE